MYIGLINTMEQALEIINSFNRKQLQSFEYDASMEGWYCSDKRKLRQYAKEVVIFNWKYDASAIRRIIHKANAI